MEWNEISTSTSLPPLLLTMPSPILSQFPNSDSPSSPQSASEPPPTQSICTFILPRKNRRCRMSVKRGSKFCVAHSPSLPTCPACGTRVHSLCKHEQVCPVEKRRRATEACAYFSKNINSSDIDISTINNDNNNSTNINPTVTQVETIVNEVLNDHHEDIGTMNEIDLLPEFNEILNDWSDSRNSHMKMEMKHFHQMSTLASLAFATTNTNANTKITIIEMGAGRAYTALFAAHVLKLRDTQCIVYAIDRSSVRLKADRTFRQCFHTHVTHFERLTIDLKHLQLSGVSPISKDSILVLGKHVCGSALDMALTCVNRFVHESNQCNHVTVVLACCCRSLCTYTDFGHSGSVWNKIFITNDVSKVQEKVNTICRAAAWGLDDSNTDSSNEKRKQVGAKCRLAVDCVRVQWLREQGWDARLWTYTDASPESTCIVATWTNR